MTAAADLSSQAYIVLSSHNNGVHTDNIKSLVLYVTAKLGANRPETVCNSNRRVEQRQIMIKCTCAAESAMHKDT